MQPYVYEFVSEQDKEWFPDGPARIRELGLFVWLLFMTAFRGNVPTVGRNDMCELLANRIQLMDRTQDEPEIKAEQLCMQDMERHPQFELLMFLMDFLVHKEDCELLVPVSTRAAFAHVDTVIRAFDRATAGLVAESGKF
jgi:hypothetical protein